MKYISFSYRTVTAILFLLLFLSTIIPREINAQTTLLNDKETSRLILQALDSAYARNFSSARQLAREIGKRIPDNPGIFLLKAFLIGQEHMPLLSGTAPYEQFETFLNRTIKESEKLLNKNENDVEGIFFSLAAHGYLAQLYADNDKNLKAAGEAQDAYDFINLGFKLTGIFPDFYFPCGLYDYYREAYPEVHPYYKAVVWLFRKGDKKLGIEMLKKGAETALFTKTENLIYLGHIYLRYEDDPEGSLPYTEKLVRLYPHNLVFTIIYVENLLSLKRCYQACPYIDRLKTSEKPYFKFVGEIFYGHYLETALSDLNGALNAYKIAQKIAGEDNIHIPHFESMLYLGMGRANKKMGNAQTATDFFRKASETAVYPAQKAEAESYLK